MRVNNHHGQIEEAEEMLLSDDLLKNSWALEDKNFLKNWEIKKNNKSEHEMEVKQKGFYNCEKEKSTYMNKMQAVKAQ